MRFGSGDLDTPNEDVVSPRREQLWDPQILARMVQDRSGEREEASESRQRLRDLIVEAVELGLTDRERRVIEGLYWQRMTYRALAREQNCHPKNICRCRNRAIEKVRRFLLEHADLLEENYPGVTDE